ncbi:hypothetical protein VTL71DRAFT_12152 [Oculimacula yallundae]|uniref:Uncharacterized protein n=1 Tax=Oculimacula yallundae TaxID=86028 RepID=A0ABR4CSF6_9HELO
MAREIGIPNARDWEDRLWAKKIRIEHDDLEKKIGSFDNRLTEGLRHVLDTCQDAWESNDIVARVEQLERMYDSNKEALTKFEELERKFNAQLDLRLNARDQQVDEQLQELRDMHASLKGILQNYLPPEELPSIPRVPGEGRTSSGTLYDEDEPHVSFASPATAINSRTRPQPRVTHIKSTHTAHATFHNPSTSATADRQVAVPSNRHAPSKNRFKKAIHPDNHLPDLYNTSMNKRKRPTATRPTDDEPIRPSPMASRNHNEHEAGGSAVHSVPAPASPEIPKMCQERRPLMVYYNEATAIRHSLDLEIGEPESKFVNAFIAGISTKEVADQLIDSLMNFCPLDVKDDGTREIFGSWDDVLEGMKNAQLYVENYQDKGKGRADDNTADFPGLRNVGAVEKPIADGQLPLMTSGGGRISHANGYGHTVEAREGHELTKDAERNGQDSGLLNKATISKARSGNVTSGTATGTSVSNAFKEFGKTKGKVANRRAPVKKPAPSTSKPSEQPCADSGRASRTVVEKPIPSRTRAGKRVFDLSGLANGAAEVRGVGVTAGTGAGVDAGSARGAAGTGRRGKPRIAKR